MGFPEPGAERVECDTDHVIERHMFANGWGAEVVVTVGNGVFNLSGSLTLKVPRLKGWNVEWVAADEAGATIPRVEGRFDTDVRVPWEGTRQLEDLLAAVRAFPEYEHECDHTDCY